MTNICKIKRAIISVSDKSGLVPLAAKLSSLGVEILSTGGSAKAIKDAGIPVIEVSSYTGFPEMMDGRVKTLHPKIHGGLLQRRDLKSHKQQAKEHNIPEIDLVVINLYPFSETVDKGADFAACIENIDIGGPSMVRSAAKNHAAVTVITSVNQYDKLIEELSSHDGGTGLEFRKHLAAAAYAHTAQYDSAISTWFAKQLGEQYPEVLNISARKKQDLRYGENPHQSAAFYSFNDNKISSIATASIIQGKPLSYNNIGDTDAAFDLISEFKDAPAVAIIKHANPCGVATGATLLEAYQKAFNCDTVSPFGGIIACNKIITKDVAEAITKIFSEVIIAPDADDEAKAVFAAKPNVRVLTTGSLPDPLRTGVVFRSVSGGVLLQSRDNIVLDNAALKCVTKRQPTAQELKDLVFAFTVAKHVKSNTIVYAKQGATVGIGAGQMNRLDSAVIAAKKAKDTAAVLGLSDTPTNGSVAASDAFFPFADGLEAIVSAGATAVIQPGGSIKDNEVIDAANKHNLAMIFTGIRHFRH